VMSGQCSYRFAAGELALFPLARTRLSAVVRICGRGIRSEEGCPGFRLRIQPDLSRLVHARLPKPLG